MAKILLLSANHDFAEDIKEQLKLYASDYEVVEDEDSDAVFEAVIVDESLAKVAQLKSKMLKTPIILLLKSGTRFDSDETLQVMYKPLRLEEFLDSVHAGINQFGHGHDSVIHFNQYELNAGTKEIVNLRNNEITKLTEREVSILKYLYKSSHKTVSKSELLSEVWGYSLDATTHTVETHIYRLRQKVEHDNKMFQIIITEDNGYKLDLIRN